MKNLFIVLLICICANVQAQTYRASTSSNSNNPLSYGVSGADRKVKSSIDSLAKVLRAEFAKSLKDSMAVARKELKDSMASLLPVSSVMGEIDKTNKSLNLYKITNDAEVKKIQEAATLTDEQVDILGIWRFKNFKF